MKPKGFFIELSDVSFSTNYTRITGTYDTAIVVTKNNESTTKGSASELGQPTKKGATMANVGAKINRNIERTKRLSDLRSRGQVV